MMKWKLILFLSIFTIILNIEKKDKMGYNAKIVHIGKEKRLTKYNPGLYKQFKKKSEIKLTPKQIVFCEEWIYDFNGSRSARVAGYAEHMAKVVGARLITNDNIKLYVDYLQRNLSQTSGISREKILNEYKRIGFSTVKNIYSSWLTLNEYEDLNDDQLAGIKSVENVMKKIVDEDGNENYVTMVRITMHDKIKGLERVERMLGYDSPVQKVKTDKEEKIKVMSDDDLDKRIARLGKERTVNKLPDTLQVT